MANGIGSWSVYMFMIFSLHRPDVLSIEDLGVRKGVQLLYNLEELPRPSQMDQLCEKWKPYRSVASWYLWWFVKAEGAPSSAAGSSLLPPQQDEQHQHQFQPHLLDPINSILNLGYDLFLGENFWFIAYFAVISIYFRAGLMEIKRHIIVSILRALPLVSFCAI